MLVDVPCAGLKEFERTEKGLEHHQKVTLLKIEETSEPLESNLLRFFKIPLGAGDLTQGLLHMQCHHL
jgi:hypothetical protein